VEMIRRYHVLHKLFLLFFRIPLADKLLLIQASLILIFLRLLLKLFPVNKLFPFINFFLKEPYYSYQDHLEYTKRVVWSIEKSGKYFLRTRCLAEAIAVQILLNKKRIINNIQIGFIKGKGNFSAHAWVVADNKILIGDNQALSYYFKITM
jgi:hypothetical protein